MHSVKAHNQIHRVGYKVLGLDVIHNVKLLVSHIGICSQFFFNNVKESNVDVSEYILNTTIFQ